VKREERVSSSEARKKLFRAERESRVSRAQRAFHRERKDGPTPSSAS
jgi:hypothetical protein